MSRFVATVPLFLLHLLRYQVGGKELRDKKNIRPDSCGVVCEIAPVEFRNLSYSSFSLCLEAIRSLIYPADSCQQQNNLERESFYCRPVFFPSFLLIMLQRGSRSLGHFSRLHLNIFSAANM